MLLNKTCPWCGRLLGNNWNREHIIPKSYGGLNSGYNIMRAHPVCNRYRGSLVPIPRLNEEDLEIYKYFTEEQTKFFIRAIWMQRRILRMYIIRYNPDDVVYLDSMIERIEKIGLNPCSWEFNES